MYYGSGATALLHAAALKRPVSVLRLGFMLAGDIYGFEFAVCEVLRVLPLQSDEGYFSAGLGFLAAGRAVVTKEAFSHLPHIPAAVAA